MLQRAPLAVSRYEPRRSAMSITSCVRKARSHRPRNELYERPLTSAFTAARYAGAADENTELVNDKIIPNSKFTSLTENIRGTGASVAFAP